MSNAGSGFSRTAGQFGIRDTRCRGPSLPRRPGDGPNTPCVTSSFQAEDVVLVHMLLKAQPDIPVLFLETFHHFPADAHVSGRDCRQSGGSTS